MKFLKKIEWLMCLATIMMMSSPALAIRTKEETKSVGGTILDVILNTLAENWFMVMMIVIVAILVIIIFNQSGSRSKYDDKHTKAFGSYFRARIMKVGIIGEKKTADIKEIFSTIREAKRNVDDLKNQIEQRTIVDDGDDDGDDINDDKETQRIVIRKSNQTQFSNKPSLIALKEKLRVAEDSLTQLEKEFGSINELEANIRELIDFDATITDSWMIMKTAPGFDPDDFKSPWD